MPQTTAEQLLQLWVDAEDGTSNQPPHSVYQFITSPIHQTGKTSFDLRQAEVVLERLHSRKFDPANIHFDIPSLMERRRVIGEWDHQCLDEPQRAVGNRNWQAQEHQIAAEDLQSTNRYHKHVGFPTPHSHYVDNAIIGICTSQVVVTRLGHAEIYWLNREQLNRNFKTRTPRLGSLTFSKPSAELWHAYNKLFDAYYSRRLDEHLEFLRAAKKQSEKTPSVLMSEDVEALILEAPQKFIGKNGLISPSKVKDLFKVPYNRAQEASVSANRILKQREELERAEKEAV